MSKTVLEIACLTKLFEGLTAVSDVNFKVTHGCIHALFRRISAPRVL